MMPQKMATQSPFSELRRLCEAGASGELIHVAGDTEVHVYLQAGRLAWATSSRAQLVFSRELIARCELDQEAFRELLDDCRKSRRPLGETLVSWGLASEEQVREALELQLRDALLTLVDASEGSTLFLERTQAFAHYDQRFTFDAQSLLDELEPQRHSQAAPIAPPRAESHALCERIVQTVPGALWSRPYGGGTGEGCGEESGTLPPVAWDTLERGVKLAVVRTGRGTAVGCADESGQEHLWIGLRNEAPLGAALSALAQCVSRPALAHARPSHVQTGPVEPPSPTEALCSRCQQGLTQVLTRTPELRALSVCEQSRPVHFARRRGVDAEAGVEASLAHLPLLQLGRSGLFRLRADSMESYGFHFCSMGLLMDGGWHFLSEVTDGSGRLVWLLLDSRASQGLGWALTSSVNRLLASQTCCGPGGKHG